MFPLERPKTDVNIRSTGGLVLSVTPSVLLTAYINYTSHCKGLYLQTDGGMMTSFGQMYSSLIEWFLSSCGSLNVDVLGAKTHTTPPVALTALRKRVQHQARSPRASQAHSDLWMWTVVPLRNLASGATGLIVHPGKQSAACWGFVMEDCLHLPPPLHI